MLHTVVLNENVRSIVYGNLEILTAKLNDLSAEKDTSTSISSMLSMILDKAETVECFSDKLKLLVENILLLSATKIVLLAIE